MLIISKSSDIRVWFIEDTANPGNTAVYQGLMKFNDPSQGLGDVEKIEAPDPNGAGRFIEIDEIQGAEERVSFGVMGRYPRSVVSDLKRISEKRCNLDIQAHLGRCRDPQDFTGGWEKIVFFEATKLTNYSTENFGALGSDEDAATNESADTSAKVWYERVRLNFAERATADTFNEVVSIDVCDDAECGDCDEPSDGCQVVFAVQLAAGNSPGLSPSVIYTDDGFTSDGVTFIDTLSSVQEPIDSECVGENFVVLSNDAGSLSYAPIADILLGTESWAEVTTGIEVGGEPNAIVSIGARSTWIVGDAGNIYFTADPTSGVTVQDAGVATSQNLADVDAYDADNVVAVGASNAVVVTTNGGNTWAAVTGPAAGVALTAVAMRSASIWFVGDANGAVWYTLNSGTTWFRQGLPALDYIEIEDIKFATSSVGVVAATISGPAGRMLGTIDGGNSWYVLPEGTGAIPANDAINQIGVCRKAAPSIAANNFYAGGLADDASDGIILKLS